MSKTKILIMLAMTLITERTLLDTTTSTRYICYRVEGNGGYMEAEKIGTMFGDKWLGSFDNYQECLDKLKQIMEKYE